MGIFPGVDDSGDDVATESRAYLHELVLVELLVHLVVEIIDFQVCAVRRKPGKKRGGNPGRKLASLGSRSKKQNVRLVRLDKVDNYLGIRKYGERFKPFVLGKKHLVAAVMVKRINGVLKIVPKQYSLGLHSEPRCELASLADQLQAHIRDLAAFLFNEYPDISNIVRRHVFHPSVWSSINS